MSEGLISSRWSTYFLAKWLTLLDPIEFTKDCLMFLGKVNNLNFIIV
jgi:hypothetical protein